MRFLRAARHRGRSVVDLLTQFDAALDWDLDDPLLADPAPAVSRQGV